MERSVNNYVDWRIGKLLDDRYEISEVLGIGGMAVVYRAVDNKLRRSVAIKVLRDDVAMDEESRRRFRTEYQAVAMLSHPNIRAVYDVVSSGDTEYIVMEYVEGINLKQYLKRKGHLDWKQTLHFSIQIARALSHAHEKGIIHMDIKPQNIMLPRDGTAKVADFGIAQLEGADTSDTDEAVGSIHYISPEQARGEAVDARTDIYSLGVVMYEMLTGRLPFDGSTVSEVAMQHFSVVPLAPSVLATEVPEGLEKIALRAMQPDVNKRFQSAAEMLSALESFRKDQNSVSTILGTNIVTLFDRERPRRKLFSGRSKQSAPAAENAESASESSSELAPAPSDADAAAQSEDGEPRYVIVRDVPRISRGGEPSRETWNRRRSRANLVSTFLGFGLVIAFAVGIFLFLWNFWLHGIFSKAERISVPNFVGYSYEDILADTSFAELFSFTVQFRPDNEVPAGQIAAQTPDEGTSRMIVDEGISVTLYVSSGIQLVTMPDLVNKPIADALDTLSDLSLNSSQTYEYSDFYPDGYVISTEPAARTEIATGSTVVICVSTGPNLETVIMPQLVGTTKDAALLELQGLGLTCTETEVTYVSAASSDKGNVIWQSYDVGTELQTGTVVYLQVGS